MIYSDSDHAGGIVIHGKELALLRSFSYQALPVAGQVGRETDAQARPTPDYEFEKRIA